MSEVKNILDQYVDQIKKGELTNLSPLLPTMFQLRGKPFSLKDHMIWEPLFNLEVPKKRTVVCGRQVGKALPKNAEVLTKTGPIPMGDIIPGSLILGPDGKEYTVTSTHEQGTRPVYQLTFDDESTCECDIDHLWKWLPPRRTSPKTWRGGQHPTKNGKFMEWKITTLRELIESVGEGDIAEDKRPIFPIINQIDLYSPDPIIIPPYTLGAILGDGCISTKSTSFTCHKKDSEIVERMNNEAVGGCSIVKHKCDSFGYELRGFTPLLKELGIFGLTSHTKYIPRRYKFSSYRDRLDLLRGLMDTDGSVYSKCHMELSTASPKLASDIQWLVRSLGGKAKIKERTSGYKKDGIYKDCGAAYRVVVKMTENPFYLKRKADRFYKIKRRPERRLYNITFIGHKETKCLVMDSTENLFITNNFTVTHNSETSAVQILSWSKLKQYNNILYVAPRDNQTKIFSNDKVAPYLDGSPIFSGLDSKLPNGTYTRSVQHGSNIYFSYAFLDAERIRSITAGSVFYDEAQDINPNFLISINQVMSASLDFGVMQSTGTPKTFDNNLETQWSQSSQAEWCIPCYKCMKLNVSSVECDLLGMIKPHGLSCAKCGQLINTRDGWWEHRYPDRRFRHEGYHGPQPIFPMHCELQPDEEGTTPQKWSDLLYEQEDLPTYGFYNEILGTSYDNASELISKTALVENSTLDHDNSYENGIKLASNRKKYNFISMGVDWGGGGESGLSRTAVAILGWKGSAKPDVLYLDRVVNPLPSEDEAAFIMRVASDFKVDLVADDYCGAGASKEIIMIQTGFPIERLMPIAYVPSQIKKMMEYVPAEDNISHPYVKVARTKSLTIMAALVNNGYYTFPKFESWDSKGYPNNLLSLVQEKRDSTRGPASYFITHKPNRPDDLAHAINYASIGYWYVTKNTPDFSKLLGKRFVDSGL